MGEYVAESLAQEGFIHASTREQVVETANLFYAGQDGLVLLAIDAARLTASLKYEPPVNAGNRDGALFPHIHGPLNLDAVTGIFDFPCGGDGLFHLPAALDVAPERRRQDPLAQATHMTEETAQKLLHFLESTPPVQRLRASQLATGVLGAVGFALFVVGVEQAAQDVPVISNAYGSIGVGVVLLLATGLLLRKLSGGE